MKTAGVILIASHLLFLASCATAPKKGAVAGVEPPSAIGRIGAAIAKYRALEEKGGWPIVPEGSEIRKGDEGERVALLRRRLKLSGDFKGGKGGEKTFDDSLEEALLRYQERHGLDTTGLLDSETVRSLNIPIPDRIRQLEVNRRRIEGWGDLGSRYVRVNIADFSLRVVENGKAVLRMNVVVGKRHDWQTPLVKSAITHLIVNPQWNVPPDIFRKEVLGHIQKDVSYLARENMKVVGDGGEVDPATVDWAGVDPKEEKYRIVQREGAGNSLGRLKFMFPNRYAIYLHDTPQKRLFSRRVRDLSHGCVRVENPLDLAEYLMRDDPAWTRERIVSSIGTGKNRWVSLPKPVNLYILYLTAWVNKDGIVEFRDDIYRRDSIEEETL